MSLSPKKNNYSTMTTIKITDWQKYNRQNVRNAIDEWEEIGLTK